jgi:hypothetical protein
MQFQIIIDESTCGIPNQTILSGDNIQELQSHIEQLEATRNDEDYDLQYK